MLAYLLALAVGFGSLSLYLAAFFFPEVHRKYDLAWSGVGMFYALVLWVCAGRITGGVLLGQVASISLIGWFGWQTLKLRRTQTPLDLQTQLPPGATSSSEVFQATVEQLRQNLRQSANTSSLLANFDRFVDSIVAGLTAIRSWMSAFVSTTINTQEGSSVPPSPSVPPTSPTKAAETQPIAPENSAPISSPSKDQLNEQIKSPSIEITTVHIKVDGLDSVADRKLNYPGMEGTKDNVTSPREVAKSFYEEPDAEWDELEIEDDPDMDTIDSALLDTMGGVEPSKTIEDWRHRSNSRESKRD